jgi:hypothetical protein
MFIENQTLAFIRRRGKYGLKPDIKYRRNSNRHLYSLAAIYGAELLLTPVHAAERLAYLLFYKYVSPSEMKYSLSSASHYIHFNLICRNISRRTDVKLVSKHQRFL